MKKRWEINIPKDKILEKLKKVENITYKDVYSTLMRESFCKGRTDLRWGEKSVLEWSNIPIFLSWYPQGKAIHIIRDPRDVVASYREITIEPKYRYLDAAFASLHSLSWIAEIGETLPNDQYFVLRHEDLVTEPQETTKQICSFLNINYEPDMLNPENYTNRNFTEKWEGNTAFGDIKEGISSHNTNRWKNHLKKHELVFVESIIGSELLQKFGYEPSEVEFKVEDMQKIWKYLSYTPLLRDRIQHWLITGEGVESYPSNPRDPANWYENRIKKFKEEK